MPIWNNTDLTKMSDEQLECLLADVKNEQDKRETARKREAWRKVIDAISEYIDNFDNIVVYNGDGRTTFLDEYYITSENYHTYGRLMPDYSEDDDEDE